MPACILERERLEANGSDCRDGPENLPRVKRNCPVQKNQRGSGGDDHGWGPSSFPKSGEQRQASIEQRHEARNAVSLGKQQQGGGACEHCHAKEKGGSGDRAPLAPALCPLRCPQRQKPGGDRKGRETGRERSRGEGSREVRKQGRDDPTRTPHKADAAEQENGTSSRRAGSSFSSQRFNSQVHWRAERLQCRSLHYATIRSG